MTTRPRHLLLLLALALGLIAALPSAASAKRTVPQGWLGAVAADVRLVWNPFLLADEAPLMASSGVETVRFPIYWSLAQPYKSMKSVPKSQRSGYRLSNGIPTNFGLIDGMFYAAAKNHLRLVPIVLAAPTWSTKDRGTGTRRVLSPDSPKYYTMFLRSLVARYGKDGTFWDDHPDLPYRPQHLWQIWNEPDHPNFYRTDWVKSYAGLVRASYTTLKKADKKSVVMLGSLTGVTWYNLRRLYKRGIRKHYDVAALHPYTKKPTNVLKTIELTRKTMRDYKDVKPVALTEVAWPASKGKLPQARNSTFAVTPKGQATNLKAVIRLLAKYRKKYRITGVYWYSWLTSYSKTSGAFEFTGLRKWGTGSNPPSSMPLLSTFKRIARPLEGR